MSQRTRIFNFSIRRKGREGMREGRTERKVGWMEERKEDRNEEKKMLENLPKQILH